MYVLPDSRYAVPAAPIFISYRRSDTSAYAEYLYHLIVEHFGEHAVFMDRNSLESGALWLSKVQFAAQTCQVMLVVIGQQWVTVTDPNTNLRRLDNPQDVLRSEVATALARGILVVPVLVDDARLPRADELADDLKPLLDREACRIRSDQVQDDIARLVKSLEPAVSPRAQVVAEPVQATYATPVAGAMPFIFAVNVNPEARDVLIVAMLVAGVLLLIYMYYKSHGWQGA